MVRRLTVPVAGRPWRSSLLEQPGRACILVERGAAVQNLRIAPELVAQIYRRIFNSDGS